jgi:hypothetical protein
MVILPAAVGDAKLSTDDCSLAALQTGYLDMTRALPTQI